MASIKNITQASGWVAAYAGKKKGEDVLEPVIVWSVIAFDEEGDDDGPDEVIGQVFDGNCITEASSIGKEEGYGHFVGYFQVDRPAEAIRACEQYRDRLAAGDIDEEDDGPTSIKDTKKKKKKADDEDEEEEEEDEDGDEEYEDEDEDEEDEDEEEDEEDEKDDFGSWKE